MTRHRPSGPASSRVKRAQNFAINTLAGSAAWPVNGSTTANAIGMVTLGNASGYTGAITVGANAALGIGSGAGFFGSGATIANFTNATSGIGLVADGDGTEHAADHQFRPSLASDGIDFRGRQHHRLHRRQAGRTGPCSTRPRTRPSAWPRRCRTTTPIF